MDTYNNQIADLEAIITPNGYNQVYMAAWYNGIQSNVFDISQFRNNSNTMLFMFWQDLIKNNEGKVCYFHNWGGYDSILSLVRSTGTLPVSLGSQHCSIFLAISLNHS